MSTGYKFECKFCGMRFKLENRFMSHRCKQMIRDEQIRTPLGQTAWSYYQKWMTSYRRAVPSIETFLTSNYYTTFIKFAQFAQKVGLPDVDTFIWYMKEKDIPPVIWINNDIYASYIEFVDKKSDPNKQAQQTIDWLFKLATEFQVDVSEIFDYLNPNDVILMLHRRQISPWILLHSPKFKDFLVNKTTDQEKTIMQAIIRPDYWAEKKVKHPEIVTQMKKYVRELDL
jgi:hypothetical protein